MSPHVLHQGGGVHRLAGRGEEHGQVPGASQGQAAQLGVTQGLQEYLNEFVSDAATGKGGYLASRGLISLPASQHEGQKAIAQKLTPMARPAS